jgi:Escherichia/Staphylococcus phage prohead protease
METDPKRTLVVPLSDVEWRDTGDPERKGETTLRGHAAVFNSLSEDLGGFRELIEPGFFRAALQRQPDVRLLINHEDLPLARTKSGTLELREDPRGLHVFARLDKNDPDVVRLRGKMQRGDVDQMSFAFTLREDGDTWDTTEDGSIVRTLREDGANELFDVSVVTYPAYRATDVSMRSVLDDAIARGRVPGTLEQAETLPPDEERDAVAPEGGSPEVAEETQGEERDTAPEEVDVEQAADLVADLKDATRGARNAANESYLRLLKEHGLK